MAPGEALGAADGRRAGAGLGATGGFIAGFAPWFVYWILSGATSFNTAVGMAFALAALGNVLTLVRHRSVSSLKVLEVGNLAAFAGLGIIGLVAGDAFVARWIQAMGNGALFLIMFVSVLVGKPFSLQYAREATTPDLWDSPGFLAVSNLITWVWVGTMGTMTAMALVPPIVQGEATRNDGGNTLSILFYWVLPYTVMGLAVILTMKYPDWFGAEFEDVPVVAGTTQPQLPLPITRDRDRTGAGAVLEVGPSETLIDEPIVVAVGGLVPGSNVEVAATNVDLSGNLWRSAAVFRADASGRMDTATAAPISGDYAGVDATALMWGMRFSTEGATPDIYVPPPEATAVLVEATTDTTTLTKTVVRRGTAADTVVREVREDDIVGRLLLPPGIGPFPGIALYGGSEGGIDSEHSNAGLLASRGYAVLIVGYFGLDGLPTNLREIPLERLAGGVRWLALHPHVDASRIGAMAISRGSEGMLSMAARIDDLPLSAIVALSPSSVSWTATGENGTARGVPSWTLAGEPVPHLAMADKVLMDQALLDAFRHRGRFDRYHPHVLHLARAYGAALDDTAGVETAAIPTEDVAAPLLCISGSDDQVWPSGPMAEAILHRRHRAGLAYADHHEHYEGAGHLFRLGCLPTDVPATGGIALGGTRPGIAAAQADATGRILAFFGNHLG